MSQRVPTILSLLHITEISLLHTPEIIFAITCPCRISNQAMCTACLWPHGPPAYSITQEICTRFCCALLCCGYAIVHNEVFIHIHQGCFDGTGAFVRLPQCQWSKPGGYGKISQCITTTKHSKQKPCAYFLGYTVLHNVNAGVFCSQ